MKLTDYEKAMLTVLNAASAQAVNMAPTQSHILRGAASVISYLLEKDFEGAHAALDRAARLIEASEKH